MERLSSQESRKVDLQGKISEIMLPLLELSSMRIDLLDEVFQFLMKPDTEHDRNSLIAINIFMEVFLKIKNEPDIYTFFSDCISFGVEIPSEIIFLMELLGFDFLNNDLERNSAYELQFSDDQNFLYSLLDSDVFTTKKLGIPSKNPLHQRPSFTPRIDLSKALQTPGIKTNKIKAGFTASCENKQKEQTKLEEIKNSWEEVIDRLLEIVDRYVKIDLANFKLELNYGIVEILKKYSDSLMLSKYFKDGNFVVTRDSLNNINISDPIIKILCDKLRLIVQTELRHKRKYKENNNINNLKSLVSLISKLITIFHVNVKSTEGKSTEGTLKKEECKQIFKVSNSRHITVSTEKLLESYCLPINKAEKNLKSYFTPEILLPELERRDTTLKFVFANCVNDFMGRSNPLVDRVVELYKSENKEIIEGINELMMKTPDILNEQIAIFYRYELKTQNILNQSTVISILVAKRYLRYDRDKSENSYKVLAMQDLLFVRHLCNIVYCTIEKERNNGREYSVCERLERFHDVLYYTLTLEEFFIIGNGYDVPWELYLNIINPIYNDKLRQLFDIDWIKFWQSYNINMKTKEHFYYYDKLIWINSISCIYACFAIQNLGVNEIDKNSLAYQILCRIFKDDNDEFTKFYKCRPNEKLGNVSEESKGSKINPTRRLLTLDTQIGEPESDSSKNTQIYEDLKFEFPNIILSPYNGLPYSSVVMKFGSIKNGNMVYYPPTLTSVEYQSIQTSINYHESSAKNLQEILIARNYDISKLVVIKHNFRDGFLSLKDHKFVDILDQNPNNYKIRILDNGNLFGIVSDENNSNSLILLEEVGPENRHKNLGVENTDNWNKSEKDDLLKKIRNADGDLYLKIIQWQNDLQNGKISKKNAVDNVVGYLTSLKLTYTKELANNFNGNIIDYTLSSVLKEKKGVCRHSAVLIQTILTTLDIKCISVSGFVPTEATGLLECHQSLNVDLGEEGGIVHIETTDIYSKKDEGVSQIKPRSTKWEKIRYWIFEKDLLELLPSMENIKKRLGFVKQQKPIVNYEIYSNYITTQIEAKNKESTNPPNVTSDVVIENELLPTLNQTVLKLVNNKFWIGLDDNNQPYKRSFDLKISSDGKIVVDNPVTKTDLKNIFIPFLIQNGIFQSNFIGFDKLSKLRLEMNSKQGWVLDKNKTGFKPIKPPEDKKLQNLLLSLENVQKIQLLLPVFESILSILSIDDTAKNEVKNLKNEWIKHFKLEEKTDQSLDNLQKLVEHMKALVD